MYSFVLKNICVISLTVTVLLLYIVIMVISVITFDHWVYVHMLDSV